MSGTAERGSLSAKISPQKADFDGFPRELVSASGSYSRGDGMLIPARLASDRLHCR
jgi:hypothetical protein